VAFAIPWILILSSTIFDISEYSRPVSIDTIRIIVTLASIGLFVIGGKQASIVRSVSPAIIKDSAFYGLFAVYFAMSAANILSSGYVPLVSLLATGESSYMDFGVRGLYGLFNAYANALGLLSFVLWNKSRRRIYAFGFFIILGGFLLFVTRQNMISLVVESFIVYQLAWRRLAGWKVLVGACVALALFAIIGDARVGQEISEIARVRAEYAWLPSPVVWLYSYCYFNVLNLDNVVTFYSEPLWDFSSFSMLLPSFLRPEFLDEGSVLEVSSFTVGSFILPIYKDVGQWSLIFIFMIFCFVTQFVRDRFLDTGTTASLLVFAVLYFCFAFSFFENFWFYLPVIFQVPIILWMNRIVFKPII
jgi:oligosaccharide repeat unit polymerase